MCSAFNKFYALGLKNALILCGCLPLIKKNIVMIASLSVSQTLCQCAAMTPSCQGRLPHFSLVMALAPTPHQGQNDQV